jgi:hypothetical protein
MKISFSLIKIGSIFSTILVSKSVKKSSFSMHTSEKRKGKKTVSKVSPFSALSGKIWPQYCRGFCPADQCCTWPFLSYDAELSASWQH